MIESIQHTNNVHELRFDTDQATIAQFSDLHWDNPKCVRPYLKKCLDYCLENDIPIILNGDTFCIMQGKRDRRGSKQDVRKEHQTYNYFNSIVDTAVEWFLPYAHLIKVVGYGNHETAIIKNQEIDVLKMFVDKLNLTAGSDIQLGGYGGWIIYNLKYPAKTRKSISFRHRYFHGSGGGGIVTRGMINLQRASAMFDGYDIFSMGHVHENLAADFGMNYLAHSHNGGYRSEIKDVHMMITGTFKDEYVDGSKGWHIERGAPPKTIGGRLLSIKIQRSQRGEHDRLLKVIDSCKLPIKADL